MNDVTLAIKFNKIHLCHIDRALRSVARRELSMAQFIADANDLLKGRRAIFEPNEPDQQIFQFLVLFSLSQFFNLQSFGD